MGKTPLLFVFIAILIIFAAESPSGWAQGSPVLELPQSNAAPEINPRLPGQDDDTVIRNRIYKMLPLEDQERLIEETHKVEAYCNSRERFASFHDCQCVAAEFFEERLLRRPDPKLNIISIADDVAAACPNIPGVAGYAYNKCQHDFGPTMKLGVEEFCTCYANVYADVYKRNPRSHFQALGKFGSIAILECDSRGLHSPLRPNF